MQQKNIKLIVLSLIIGLLTIGCTSVASVKTDLGAIGKLVPKSNKSRLINNDTLAPGIFIAAMQYHDWESTGSMAQSVYVSIVTPATEETKYQAQVQLETTDGSGETKWSPFVFQSHKASKDELTVGTWVLVVEETFAVENKETNSWRYVQIKKLDNLFKDLVGVSYLNTYGGRNDKDFEVHYDNIRIVENPIELDQLWFGSYK